MTGAFDQEQSKFNNSEKLSSLERRISHLTKDLTGMSTQIELVIPYIRNTAAQILIYMFGEEPQISTPQMRKRSTSVRDKEMYDYRYPDTILSCINKVPRSELNRMVDESLNMIKVYPCFNEDLKHELAIIRSFSAMHNSFRSSISR